MKDAQISRYQAGTCELPSDSFKAFGPRHETGQSLKTAMVVLMIIGVIGSSCSNDIVMAKSLWCCCWSPPPPLPPSNRVAIYEHHASLGADSPRQAIVLYKGVRRVLPGAMKPRLSFRAVKYSPQGPVEVFNIEGARVLKDDPVASFTFVAGTRLHMVGCAAMGSGHDSQDVMAPALHTPGATPLCPPHLAARSVGSAASCDIALAHTVWLARGHAVVATL